MRNFVFFEKAHLLLSYDLQLIKKIVQKLNIHSEFLEDWRWITVTMITSQRPITTFH